MNTGAMELNIKKMEPVHRSGFNPVVCAVGAVLGAAKGAAAGAVAGGLIGGAVEDYILRVMCSKDRKKEIKPISTAGDHTPCELFRKKKLSASKKTTSSPAGRCVYKGEKTNKKMRTAQGGIGNEYQRNGTEPE